MTIPTPIQIMMNNAVSKCQMTAYANPPIAAQVMAVARMVLSILIYIPQLLLYDQNAHRQIGPS